uniref:Nodulin-26 n=1 Tax=Solanum tuberosum TaxID=4113 RepID=M1A503_SOLTU
MGYRRRQRRGRQLRYSRRYEWTQWVLMIGSQCPDANACLWMLQHGELLIPVSPTFPHQMSLSPERYTTTT